MLFYFYFKMDNVLRETIRSETKAILGDKESRNEAHKTQTENCKKKSDKRLIVEQYKTLRLKDGGGIRYIDVETSTVFFFKEIRETATHLYFDHDASQNSFIEDETNCLIELLSMSGQNRRRR